MQNYTRHLSSMMSEIKKHLKNPQIGVAIWSLSLILVVFSSPMPRDVGVIEVLIGVGLVLGGFQLLFSGAISGAMLFSRYFPVILLLVIIVTPLIVGLNNGNSLKDIARDILPVMFLTAIPTVLMFTVNDKSQYSIQITIITALLFVGIVSSVQFTSGVANEYGSLSGFVSNMKQGLLQLSEVRMETPDQGDVVETPGQGNVVETPSHLSMVFLKAYDPAVLFTAIFLIGLGLKNITCDVHLMRLFAAVSIALGLFCAYSLVSLGLRAHALLMIFSLFVVLINYVNRLKNIKALIIAITLCSGFVIFYFHDALYLMMVKQASVGTNGKVAEFHAAMMVVYADLYTVLLGDGWGAKFYNPILMYETRFTHSLLSFLLLKTGIIGLFGIAWLFLLLLKRINIKALWDSPYGCLLVMSSAPPVIIGIATQPVYKMLSYGLIVALLILVLRDNSGGSNLQSIRTNDVQAY